MARSMSRPSQRYSGCAEPLRLILVTGRELDDLIRIMPRLDLFDIVVAENGAVLYWPETRQERTLAAAPPPESPRGFVSWVYRRFR